MIARIAIAVKDGRWNAVGGDGISDEELESMAIDVFPESEETPKIVWVEVNLPENVIERS